MESPNYYETLQVRAGASRREIAQAPLRPNEPQTFAVPAGARKLAVHVRGRDAGGEFVAGGEISLAL